MRSLYNMFLSSYWTVPSPGQGADIRFTIGRSGFSAQFNYSRVSQPFTVDTAFMFDYYNQRNIFYFFLDLTIIGIVHCAALNQVQSKRVLTVMYMCVCVLQINTDCTHQTIIYSLQWFRINRRLYHKPCLRITKHAGSFLLHREVCFSW